MFRCVTYIKIVQGQQPGRNKTLSFDFVNEFNATDTWVDLTNQAEVKFPKNIYVRDEQDNLFYLGDPSKNAGGFDNNTPLFLRGDKITISFGYRYYLDQINHINEVEEVAQVFDGYIVEVSSKKPITLKCEDNMYLLKQISCTPQTWKGTVEDLFASLLKDTKFTVNRLTQTTIGPFMILNETVAQLADRLRKDAHLECYFKNVKQKDGTVISEFRVGSKVYLDSDNVDANGNAISTTFKFQQNIISDDLQYKRKDDVILSAIVNSNYETFTGDETADGFAKTKKEKLQLLVFWNKKKKKSDGSLGDWDYIKKLKNVELPPNVEGERRTLHFINILNEKKLFQKGIEELQKYFYTGFKGKFVTFGIPYIKQGDNVNILDDILPERNGRYKVKGVEYNGGVQGHRQTIILDYLITSLDANGKPIQIK